MNEAIAWESVLHRDPNADDRFLYAVTTTGIYCRPSCPSRRPKRDNVAFFSSFEAAERAGFRACQRCRPNRAKSPDRAVQRARDYIDTQSCSAKRRDSVRTTCSESSRNSSD